MAAKYFLIIRHGKTTGNMERRYIGNTYEPLCADGFREAEILARSEKLPAVSSLLSGPALRCRQTAKILFPDVKAEICSMREIDFGIFKGKNADDLIDNKDYKAWLETNCMGDIPGGDSVDGFKVRCCAEFKRIAETSKCGITAMVIHGGNIMSILEAFVIPHQNFFNYHIPNCGFFLCRYENDVLTIEDKGGAV